MGEYLSSCVKVCSRPEEQKSYKGHVSTMKRCITSGCRIDCRVLKREVILTAECMATNKLYFGNIVVEGCKYP